MNVFSTEERTTYPNAQAAAAALEAARREQPGQRFKAGWKSGRFWSRPESEGEHDR